MPPPDACHFSNLGYGYIIKFVIFQHRKQRIFSFVYCFLMSLVILHIHIVTLISSVHR